MPVPFVQKALTIDLSTGAHEVREIQPREMVLGPLDFGWKEYRKDRDVFTFGEGPLASSALPGARRLVFCAHSDQWEGFYISSMGGAAHTFQHVGVNYVALKGSAAEPSVLLLHNRGDGPEVRIEPLPDFEEIWAGYEHEGKTLIGVFALQQALMDRYGGEYNPRRVRIAVVGPAAARTKEGAIASNPVKKGALHPAVVDLAGRGGLGSRLFRRHNIVGIVFGGDWMDPAGMKAKELNPWFQEHFGDKMTQVDMASCVKYHYNEKLGTGGTFGSNYATLKDRVMTFNYRSTREPLERRLRHWQTFIHDHYLAQFNEETIRPKKFDHCGEPCSVACKKIRGEYKKDYEPYHSLGPQCGVFDQRAAEKLNYHADAMGFDAIQIGGMLAWLMECVSTDLIDPAEFGLPPKERMNFPRFLTEPGEEFDIERDSMRNAEWCIAAMDAILNDERAELFRKGYRVAAVALAERGCLDVAVYLANGEEGCMVPNQYWVPGMGAPMPIMGKYYVYYGSDFLPPEDLGRRCVERMVHEMINDNCGECRFHRGWAEALLPIIVNERFGLHVDFRAHHFRLAKEIFDHQGHLARPWPTMRMAEMLKGYLENFAPESVSTEGEVQLLEFREEEPIEALHHFWAVIRAGVERAFRLGPEAIPRVLTPKQQREKYALR